MSPLWTSDEIARAVGGEAHGAFQAGGVTFDSREVEPGDLFIALRGEATDGHRFVPQAFAKGAAGALVSEKTSYLYHILTALNHYPERFESDRSWEELGRPRMTLAEFARGR